MPITRAEVPDEDLVRLFQGNLGLIHAIEEEVLPTGVGFRLAAPGVSSMQPPPCRHGS